MQVVKIDGKDSYIMYNLCFNNWENIEKLSNEKTTFKCSNSADGSMSCKIKTKDETFNIKEIDNYLLGISCFGNVEIYKQTHLK